MLVIQLLEDLRQRGVTLVADGDRLRFRPREAVPPDLKTLLAQHKAELLTLLQKPAQEATPAPALRQALRTWYAMTTREADGNLPIPAEAQTLLSDIRRLWDDVGPAFAEAVARQEAQNFFHETRRCPYCGERDVFHDPERGGDA